MAEVQLPSSTLGDVCVLPNTPKEDAVSTSSSSRNEGIGEIVAKHYNTLEERGLADRNQSRIVYMRSFNNWIKSMLINDYMYKLKTDNSFNGHITVLDMGCGKGGDLRKWKKANISHLICADIAETSIEQCKNRYKDLGDRNMYDRNPRTFSCEFIVADCTKERLKPKFKTPDIKIDLVSIQFAFHYCFESLPQAEQMLQNVSERLRPGGYFIGTTPDAFDIMKRLQESETGSSFGNDVYKITREKSEGPVPLFGAQYHFHLQDVVDCPEFLVHFPTLTKLAKKYDLKLVSKERFEDFYDSHKEKGRSLLGNMMALETYPPFPGKNLVGKVPEDYVHVDVKDHERVGTLSKSEWEAISLYIVFAFQKVESQELKRNHSGEEEEEPEKKKTC